MGIRDKQGRSAVLAVLMGLICSGCGEKSSAAKVPATPAVGSITGYGNLNLGASFEAVLASERASRFDAWGVADCIKKLPTKGCLLMDGDGVRDVHEGVPYRLKLLFNRLGILTDIELGYEARGTISSAECQSIHERALDWSAREFGGFGYEPNRVSAERVRKTAGGVTYELSKMEQDFIATLLPDDLTRSRRHLSSMSSFLVIEGKGNCRVGVTLSEPDKVERPNLDPTS